MTSQACLNNITYDAKRLGDAFQQDAVEAHFFKRKTLLFFFILTN